jgi:hypothetical protein
VATSALLSLLLKQAVLLLAVLAKLSLLTLFPLLTTMLSCFSPSWANQKTQTLKGT